MDKQGVEKLIKQYPDFPQKGILFRDIHPVLRNVEARTTVLKWLAERYVGKAEVIVGLESRGYYFGMLLAHELKLPFVVLRKAGKLPGKCHSLAYGLEYGKAELEIQDESIVKGQKVIIIDDLMATGGTASAAVQLVQQVGAQVVEVHCFIELDGLNGKAKLPSGVAFHTFFTL